MQGGPKQYLLRLADKLNIGFFRDADWDEFTELVATRNVIVHGNVAKADERYVRNAGPSARASVGEILDVDNSYLTTRYVIMKVLMLNFLQVVQGRPKLTD
jgi:hypothetical protein